MNFLYHAHSGLRYLVFLAGAVALVMAVQALARPAAPARPQRIATSAFAGLLHLQILLGIGVLVVRPWYPALMGHLVMMVLAAVAAPVLGRWARGEPDPGRAARLALAAVAAPLVLVLLGVMAIRSHPFQMMAG